MRIIVAKREKIPLTMLNPLNPRNQSQMGQNTQTMNLSGSLLLHLLASVKNYIDISKRRRMKGGDGFNAVVNMLVAQERKQAKLELQQSAQRPG